MNKILLKRVAPILAGGILGYAYYYYIGCNSGGCPITGSPYVSTLYGALIGLIMAFPTKKNEKEDK